MTVAAADLGGTKLALAALTDGGKMIARQSIPLAGRQGAEVGSLIAKGLGRLTVEHDCNAVGVSVPGLYRASKGTVWAPNIPGWDDYPLLAEMRSALGSTVRVTIDSDRAA